MSKEEESRRRKAHYAANSERLNATSAAYREVNRDKINTQKREHYRKNRERLLMEKKEKNATPEAKKKRREYDREYHAAYRLKRDPAKTKEQQQRYRNTERGKKRSRAYHLRKVYDISVDDYDAMMVAQDGRCGTCGDMPGENKMLAVDHDHTTGAVRGLLCINCNAGAGLLKDDPKILRAMADWLENPPGISAMGEEERAS